MNRRSNALSAFGVVLVLIPLAASAHAQEAGRIDGRVMRPDGTAVVAATVLVNETRASTLTGPDGRFVFVGVPAGTYSVSIVLGSNETAVPNVGVNPGDTTFLQQTVDWVAGFEEALIVQGSSRRLERIVDAPAAVTTVGAAEIASRGTHGQLPKLLEFTPGAEATQSGVYDFNLNVRGFNSSLNRRVAVLVDGRDISEPFLGAQEWASVSFPLDDLATLELLRGPSAALYGANASSGILNMISKEPRFTPGGVVRITGGELGTANLDFRWAGALNDVWFARGIGGVRKSGDFSLSRRGTAEYTMPCTSTMTSNCLPQEAVRLAREDDNQILFAGLRLDRYVRDAMRLTFEGGLADVAGPLFQTGIGRVQVVDAVRPWARAGVAADRYSVFAAYSRRKADEQLSLASGAVSTLDSQRLQLEGQTNWSFAGDRGRVVAGASAGFEHVDTFNEAIQAQTLVFEPVSTNRQAVFGQLDWNLTEQVKLVVASRADAGTLHDFQISPKGAVVFSPVRDHSFRVTYNKAFQVPNYSELFLQADAAPPVNLSALNALCAPFSVNCGFGVTRILAVGNEQLDVERIETWEAGYKGLLGGRALVTADFHTSDATNFITDLLPQLGTSLGRISSGFGPWQAPAGLPAAAADQIRALAPPTLSNNRDGSNVLAVVSYANFGHVSTKGVDLALSYAVARGWQTSAAYSRFDFSIEDRLAGFDTLLLPNAPEHAGSFGLAYERQPVTARFDLRWVDDFTWAVGPFRGMVEAYAVVDTTASYALRRDLTVGVNVANLFNNRHWESFGGDIIGRRALASLEYGW